MSGLTPKKKEELKQMMGKYSGKVCLSLMLREESLEDISYIDWSEGVLRGKKRVLICEG